MFEIISMHSRSVVYLEYPQFKLIDVTHKRHLAMHTPGKVIRIVFLDFRKAFDLIDHNKRLETFIIVGVRPALVGWFASYVHGRSQITSFQSVQSDLRKVKGGVPQESKLAPIAFILNINQLHANDHNFKVCNLRLQI